MLQEEDNKRRWWGLQSRRFVSLSRFCEFNVHMSEAPRAREEEEGEEDEIVSFQLCSEEKVFTCPCCSMKQWAHHSHATPASLKKENLLTSSVFFTF